MCRWRAYIQDHREMGSAFRGPTCRAPWRWWVFRSFLTPDSSHSSRHRSRLGFLSVTSLWNDSPRITRDGIKVLHVMSSAGCAADSTGYNIISVHQRFFHSLTSGRITVRMCPSLQIIYYLSYIYTRLCYLFHRRKHFFHLYHAFCCSFFSLGCNFISLLYFYSNII